MREYHMICRVGKRGEPVRRVCTIGTDSGADPMRTARSMCLARGRGYKAFRMTPEEYAQDLNGNCPINIRA